MRFWVRRTPVEVMGVDSIVSSRRRAPGWPCQIQVHLVAVDYAEDFKRYASKIDMLKSLSFVKGGRVDMSMRAKGITSVT